MKLRNPKITLENLSPKIKQLLGLLNLLAKKICLRGLCPSPPSRVLSLKNAFDNRRTKIVDDSVKFRRALIVFAV